MASGLKATPWSATSPEPQNTALADCSRADIPLYQLRGLGTGAHLGIGWETDPSVAAQSPKSEEFARLWQRAQKIVFSSSLHAVSTERIRIERTFNPETAGEIKASVDHDLAVSGADLASTAWRMSLIDEVHLFIAPILVGGGQHMFPEQIRHPLELLDERRFGNGMVFVRYAVAS